ncbi:hypothetical protein [Thermomonas sp.]|uniref:hypothetical protein n=1 Tax=Thermomonas sp. TaxID=1971895 RepID=UPI0035AE55D2
MKLKSKYRKAESSVGVWPAFQKDRFIPGHLRMGRPAGGSEVGVAALKTKTASPGSHREDAVVWVARPPLAGLPDRIVGNHVVVAAMECNAIAVPSFAAMQQFNRLVVFQ